MFTVVPFIIDELIAGLIKARCLLDACKRSQNLYRNVFMHAGFLNTKYWWICSFIQACM